jgi:hypothetical protein
MKIIAVILVLTFAALVIPNLLASPKPPYQSTPYCLGLSLTLDGYIDLTPRFVPCKWALRYADI